MQYLAQVVAAPPHSNAPALHLLARQLEQYLWERLDPPQTLAPPDLTLPPPGTLLLVTLTEEGEAVATLEDATPWVLEVIETFLRQGVTPETLAQEVARAEQWRQSLTLDNQEVERRALETAARRDEIQELEKKLKVEQEQLAQREAELEAWATALGAQLPGAAKAPPAHP